MSAIRGPLMVLAGTLRCSTCGFTQAVFLAEGAGPLLTRGRTHGRGRPRAGRLVLHDGAAAATRRLAPSPCRPVLSGLRVTPPAVAGTLGLADPQGALALGTVCLGENLGALSLGGVACVLLAALATILLPGLDARERPLTPRPRLRRPRGEQAPRRRATTRGAARPLLPAPA